jgi:hypothetical protein
MLVENPVDSLRAPCDRAGNKTNFRLVFYLLSAGVEVNLAAKKASILLASAKNYLVPTGDFCQYAKTCDLTAARYQIQRTYPQPSCRWVVP